MVVLNDRYVNDNLLPKGSKEEKSKFVIQELFLPRRRIESIESLTLCPQVKKVYIQENAIASLKNIGCMPRIDSLYAQQNKIQSMEGLECLKRLKTLFLGFNMISVVEKLEHCSELEELHVEKQNFLGNQTLYFEPLSVQAVALSLKILDVSGNRLTSIESLASLLNLEELDASANELSDLNSVCWSVGCMASLRTLNLTFNPVCRDHCYKNKVIAAVQYLVQLDGKEILDVHRNFYKAFEAEKGKRYLSKTTSEEPLKCSEHVQSLVDNLPTGVRIALKKSVADELHTKSDWSFK